MKKGSWWPAVIASALTLHVVGSLIVVYLATSDPSYAVEEDYYQKAVNWSEKQAQDRRNDELGWSLTFAVAPPTTPGELPKIEAHVSDGRGQALSRATITLETFHKARSDDVLHVPLVAADEAGLYAASPAMGRNGLWELRFTVTKGADTFTHNETRHLFVEGNW